VMRHWPGGRWTPREKGYVLGGGGGGLGCGVVGEGIGGGNLIAPPPRDTQIQIKFAIQYFPPTHTGGTSYVYSVGLKGMCHEMFCHQYLVYNFII
jgi:hypothetical protein